MTAENFSYYLKNPGHLYQVSYQELKSLVVQYPYCQNLRFLLLSKSQIENSEEYQTDLALAATYHVDRSLLYQLIHQKENTEDSENFVLNEDFLELKDITINSEENELAILAQEETILPQENTLELLTPKVELASSTSLTESSIPQEAINEMPNDNIDDEEVDETLELTELPDSEIPTSSLPEDSTAEEIADNISDESDMISYMEKPKKSKSVIDQLLGKEKGQKKKGKIISLTSENKITPEDELESPPSPAENDFKDLTPIKESTRLGKEVLFEITNKTDKEIDALMEKANQAEEDELVDENLGYLDSKEETKSEDSVQPLEASTPTPKTSFKSYLDQFQPPEGFIEEVEEEKELANAIDEAVEEEVELIFIKKKKSKKKKKKLMSKVKLKKKAKKEKKEKKESKKKKAKVVAEANKSVQQSDDIVSETLAKLLAKQGSHKKAIQMYKRLSLIFPKKSSFFAKKIAKLKK
ncbi:MAG: hypothetical protein AB8H03_05645 [Saprospiraceae bacterium]